MNVHIDTPQGVANFEFPRYGTLPCLQNERFLLIFNKITFYFDLREDKKTSVSNKSIIC